jgi:hypothetical protein
MNAPREGGVPAETLSPLGESNGDSEMHPLQWAALRGVVARTVFGAGAACPYAAGSLGALCWRYGLKLRETGRSVSRETTGKHKRRGGAEPRQGPKRPSRQPRWGAEDRAALVKLLAAGFRHGEVAVILGRSYEGVEGKLKALKRRGEA